MWVVDPGYSPTAHEGLDIPIALIYTMTIILWFNSEKCFNSDPVPTASQPCVSTYISAISNCQKMNESQLQSQSDIVAIVQYEMLKKN